MGGGGGGGGGRFWPLGLCATRQPFTAAKDYAAARVPFVAAKGPNFLPSFPSFCTFAISFENPHKLKTNHGKHSQ